MSKYQGVFIPLSANAENRQEILTARLGSAELLCQLTEECAELIQAANKMRRVIAGTTPALKEETMEKLIEEAADVALVLDMLIYLGLIDVNGLKFIGRYKADRWYIRTFFPGAKDDISALTC